MNDRLLSLLGLARRAGRVSLGFDPVCESVAKGEAALVLVAADISEGSLRKLRSNIDKYGVCIEQTPYDIDSLAAAVGKAVRVISVNDSGFAAKVKELLDAGCAAE